MTKKPTIWNDAKIKRLKELFPKASNDDIAEELGMSVPTLKKKAYELGLKKLKTQKGKITPEKREKILRLYHTYSYNDISEMMGLSVSTLQKVIKDAVAHGYSGKTREEVNQLMSSKRKELLKRERGRASFGFDQKTRLKIWPNKKKWRVREQLKRNGYEIERNSTEAYAYIDTDRKGHKVLEELAKENGIKVSEMPFDPLTPDEICDNGEAEIEIAKEEGLL